MSSEYKWFLPQRVIYAQLQGEITVEDLYKGNEAISRFLYESRSQSVHLIFDAKEMTGISFNVVSAWGILSYLKHARLKWIIMFGVKGVLVSPVRIFVTVIGSAIRLHFHLCDHLSEALSFLQKQDSTLPDLDDVMGNLQR